MNKKITDFILVDTDICNRLNNLGYFYISDIAGKSLSFLYEELHGEIKASELLNIINSAASELSKEYYTDKESVLIEGYNISGSQIINLHSGSYVDDAPISVLQLSTRPANALRRTHIDYITDLLIIDEDKLRNIKSLGAGSVDEILKNTKKYLLENESIVELLPYDESYDLFMYGNKLYRNILIDDMDLSVRANNALHRKSIESLKQLVEIDVEELLCLPNMGRNTVKEISRKVAQALKENRTAFPNKENSDQKEERDIEGLAEKAMARIREASLNGVTISDISIMLFDCVDQSRCRGVIETLIENDKVYEVSGRFFETRQSIIDVIMEETDDRNRQITVDRLNGLTLEEIGKKYGITRERARQISKRMIVKIARLRKNINPLYEEQFKYIYTTYELNANAWKEYVEDSPVSFYYLSTLYDKGKADPSLMVDDLTVPEIIRNRVQIKQDTGGGEYIDADGEKIPLKRAEIENYVIKKYFSDGGTIEEFFDKYNAFLTEHGISKDTELYSSKSSEATRINRISSQRTVLWKQNRRLRYYDIDAYDYTELLDGINLSEYDEVEISTRKFMFEKPSLIEKYDIRDEYELHNLLKKIISDDKIQFGRMPMIVISSSGKFSRDNFILEIISKNVGVSKYELSKIIAKITGVKQDVIFANWINSYDALYVNGKYIDPRDRRKKEQRKEANKKIKTSVELSQGFSLSKEELDNILRILNKRYTGKTATTIVQIAGDNSDLPISKMNLASQKYYGMTRTELLKKIGVLQSGMMQENSNMTIDSITYGEEETAEYESNADDDVLIFMKAKLRDGTRINAQGKYNKNSGECKVFANSIISPTYFVKEDGTSVMISRNGILMEDVAFQDPTSAAKLVCGMVVNGARAWKLENGKPLAEIL